MASPEWFFSTLAQSSAAIIGFVLAFSAVLHQLERQRREKRTDTLRDELIELKEEYQYVLLQTKQLFTVIAGESNITQYFDKYEASIQTPENPKDLLKEIRQNHSIEYPRSAVIAVYLNKIHVILSNATADSDPAEDYLLDTQQFDLLRQTVENTILFISGEDGRSKGLFNELNVGWNHELTDSTAAGVFGYFDEGHIEVRQSALLEEELCNDIAGWLNGKIPEADSDYTGKNIRSIEILLGLFSVEFQKIDAHRNNTLLDYEPTVSKNIIKGSAFLALTGVFIPITFLLTLPSNTIVGALGGWPLTWLQATVLMLSGVSTAYLLIIILRNLDDSWDGLQLAGIVQR